MLTIKEVKITSYDIKKAKQFTLDRLSQKNTLYHSRGGFKSDDILIGALAEIAIYKMLKKHYKIGKPDFTLHSKKKKSYNADLTDGFYHFHVKGQSLDSALRYGVSWLLQRNDPLICNLPDNNFIVPCLVDIKNKVVKVYGINSIKYLHDNHCFGECRVKHFQFSKVALYWCLMESTITNKGMWSIIGGHNVKN